MSSIKEQIAFLAKDALTNKFMHAILVCQKMRTSSNNKTLLSNQGVCLNPTISKDIVLISQKTPAAFTQSIQEMVDTFRQYSFLADQ